jgi:SAM-dependent methyltransferase
VIQFHDHFSAGAAEYARFRPRYPAALFAFLAGLPSERSMAWDCATGSGQAAVALAEHFARVIATDASAAQIAHGEPHPHVQYQVAAAEQSGLPGASVDLISVAQALHWFDLPAFYTEAARVLRPGGILAAWCYAVLTLPSPELQRCVDRFYKETVGPYWPPERALVEDGYRSLPFPWPEIPSPAFAMEAPMSLDTLIGYLGTWSATQRYRLATGVDPLPDLREELATLWGDPQTLMIIQWPLALRVGRKPAWAMPQHSTAR